MAELTEKQRKWRARLLAILIGLGLGLSCQYLPPEYQAVCHAVAKTTAAACGGG